jgi:hypothetical protein
VLSLSSLAAAAAAAVLLQLIEAQLDEWMDAFHTMLTFTHQGLAAADAAGVQAACRPTVKSADESCTLLCAVTGYLLVLPCTKVCLLWAYARQCWVAGAVLLAMVA